jgi:hypothetical protein
VIVKFPNKGKVSTFDCYQHSVSVSYLKTGDFITYHGELCRVVTIQRNCESITRGARPFTMVTLSDRSGNIYPVRDFHGKVSIFRGRVIK